jgi:peroxiredoxin
VLGASFDQPGENKTFAEAQQFGFRLLSDFDRSVGRAYEVVRAPDEQYADTALRIAYLIGPDGVIGRSYQVTDVAGFADQVLADLGELKGA